MSRTPRKILLGIATVAILAGCWWFLAPSQLGGKTAYVVTYGTSMEPRFHAGDLAVVRAQSSYHVGEIVAYRNAELGDHVVLHRIIGIDGNRYTFKGDNNDFVDSDHPTRADLVGKLDLHVPAAGRYLSALRRGRLPILLAAAALFVALGLFGTKETRRRRPAHTGATAAGVSAPGLVLGAGALLVAFALVTVLAYTRPTSTSATAQGVYDQSGRFAYDAAAPAGGPVYGRTTVSTGEPLFLRLVDAARFSFTYRVTAAASHSFSGRLGLDAEISAPDGWRRRLELAAPSPFHGDRAVVAGTLDLRSLEGTLARVSALSNAGSIYTLTLLPRVQLAGTVAGRPVHDTFAPTLPFELDQYQLQLQPGSAAGAGAQLEQTQPGSGTTVVPATLRLQRLRLSVATARKLALAGDVASVLLLLGALLYRPRPGAEAGLITRDYRDLLVPVAAAPRGTGVRYLEVGSFEALARSAEQLGQMILHVTDAAGDLYLVDAGSQWYRYRVEREVDDTSVTAEIHYLPAG